MPNAISTALTGINAASTAIDVVGNNLANLNTTGFKAASVSFEDLLSEFLGGSSNNQVGLGVQPPVVLTQFAQGSLQPASGPFDAAISGNGFFIVKDSNNQTLLTRDGTFQADADGNLVTATGQLVQGWEAAADGTVNTSGPITGLTVPVGKTYPPIPTTTFSLDANLDASAATGATFSQQIQAVDSLGNTVPLTVTFTKSATAEAWSYQVTVPASSVSPGTGTTPVNLLTTPGTATFDSNGVLVTPALADNPIALTVPPLQDGATIGAAGSNIVDWSFYNTDGSPKITQFAQPSAASANAQDGKAAALLTGVAVGSDGDIVATYSNGIQQIVGELALGTVRNTQSLASAGNNNLALTGESSALTIGPSGTGGRGTIIGQSLEASTVNITTEFANLLIYQRSYQANSRVITASDEIVQDTLQLIK
jgi:flagellar hook protein FlgE